MFHWRLTGFYGHPSTSCRSQSWNLLRNLASSSKLLWLCGGDFNEILCLDEKEGRGVSGVFVKFWSSEKLWATATSKTWGLNGEKFTWMTSRNRGIKEPVDPFLACHEWCTRFPLTSVTHLNPIKSDHIPILVDVRDGPPDVR